MGPKPFSNSGSSSDFSFDKVFSVPQAPGGENGSGGGGDSIPYDSLKREQSESVEQTINETHYENENGLNGKKDEHEDEEIDSVRAAGDNNGEGVECNKEVNDEELNDEPPPQTPKTPSTAERRKVSFI